MTAMTLLADSQSSNPFAGVIGILIPIIIIGFVALIVALIVAYLLLRSRIGQPTDPDSLRADIDRLNRLVGNNDDRGTKSGR
ncbi:MAG: hypothetical protein H5T78_08865 [Nocardia sp.]|nr:hypothetical protein [Nocardia sp.]